MHYEKYLYYHYNNLKMADSMHNYVPFLTFIFIGAFTPGPNNCMALSHSARRLGSGVIFSLGVFGGMIVVMLASGFLSEFLTQHLAYAETFMKILGGGYMVWLAWSLWESGRVSDEPVQENKKLLLTGCILQLINPKLIAYGITAFSVFILPNYRDTTSIVWFAGLLAAVGFAGTLTWAVCGAVLKRSFQKHPVAINRILAVMVLGCAVSTLV